MMELLLSLSISFLVLAWLRPHLASALLLFLLPSYQLRFSLGPVPMTVLELLLLLLVAAWAVRRWREGGRALAHLPWRWTFLLLALAATIAVFVSPDRVAGLGYLKAYFLEPLLFFLVLWDTITTERQVRILLLAVAASALAVGLIALEQYVHVLPSLEPWINETPRRVVSLFDFPNAVGLYLAPIIGLFAGFASQPRTAGDGPQSRWFFWGVIGLSLLAIVFAFSRGAILAVGAGLGFLAFMSPYRKWLLVVLAAGLVVALAMPMSRSIVTGVVTGTDVSTDVRLVLWQGTARLLQAHPIVGAGLGGFPILYDQYRLIKHTELLLYPHNIALNFWVEIGLAGLALMGWLLVDAFRRGARLLHGPVSPFAQRLLLGVLTALIMIVVHGLIDVPFFKNDLAVQFFFLLSLIPIAGRLRAETLA